MLKLFGLKFDSYKKFNTLLASFTGKHLTQNIYCQLMEKVYQLLLGFFCLSLSNFLKNLYIPAKGLNVENINGLILNTLSNILTKNTTPNFYFIQTKHCL
jgi:hypothetical protein